MSWTALIGSASSILATVLEGLDGDKKRQAELALKQLEAAQAEAQAQLAVNQAEAQHSSVFVSGWRPAIGWTIAAVIAVEFVVRPLATWLALAFGWNLPELPSMVDDALWELMAGMLGLSGLRSWEKTRRVAR